MGHEEQAKRWRLILGEQADASLQTMGCSEMSPDERILDEALAAIYDETGGDFSYGGGRGAGKEKSSPRIARWLMDIRTYFPEDLVTVIQSDAIERKGLQQLLLEPEMLKSVKPDLEIVKTLMALKGRIPEKTKETAREVVRAVVDEINKRLENDLRRAVTGALYKLAHSPIPSASSMDWKMTIRKNLRNYNPELNRIVPERFFFFDRSQNRAKWTVILDMDQSGSMADSVIYGSIAGCIFASMSSLKTHVVAFDTQVVDLTEQYGRDPVDMIFGVQLGGGTDINSSVAYCQQYVAEPRNTLFILLTDLCEGGNQSQLITRLAAMKDSGVKVMTLLALSDRGRPYYDERLAKKLVSLGIPCFVCTPNKLPDMVEGVLKGMDLMELAKRMEQQRKDKR